MMALVCMMMVSCAPDETGLHQGREYVDLGLSVKWATCNVGATSAENNGVYYAWGETLTKERYDKENCLTLGKTMDDIAGSAEFDAATANWGGDWRMPTETEMKELLEECKWKWTKQDGVKGYKVTGPNKNSIFLPAAGYRVSIALMGSEVGGYYWCSTPSGNENSEARQLMFDPHTQYTRGFLRDYGNTIRPVLE